MIDKLEARVLFSYVDISDPSAVMAAGQAVIADTSPSDVLATAGDGFSGPLAGPVTPTDPAMAEVIAYHEGFRASVYTDTAGNLTVGYGLNLSKSNKAFATKCLASAGLSYKSLLAASKADPSAAVITPDQAWTALLYAVYVKVNTAGRVYGPQFYRLDRDPQIALVDMTYRGDVPGKTGPADLLQDISGSVGNNYATDYTKASQDVFSQPASRQADDAALMLNGEYPTTFEIAPLSLNVGDTDSLDVITEGAKGKGIILSDNDVQFSSDDTNVAAVDDDGNVTGVANGSATMTEALVDDPDISAEGDVTVGSAAGTFNIPTDGTPVQLTGVSAGQSVSVEVQYSTTDENEDGEGESLLIASGSGFSATDASYNATTVYSFVAGPGDTVTATPQGWDGDESATVTARVQAANAAFTPQQQDALSTTANDLDTTAAGEAGAAGAFTDDAGMSTAADTTAALTAAASAELGQLAVDPTDKNFTAIARPAHPTTAVFSHATDFNGVKNAKPLAASIDAVELNLEQVINLAAASYTTENRIDGAIAAKNKKWTLRQTATLESYKKQEASLLAAEPALAQRETLQLNTAGFGQTKVSPQDVDGFETTVDDDGLPSALVTILDKLGISSSAQQQIQQALFAQDTNTASGTYDSILANVNLKAALLTAGELLRQK